MFSVNLITKLAEADEILAFAQELKETIEFEITSYNRKTNVTGQNAEKLQVTIETVTAEIEVLTEILASGKITNPVQLRKNQKRLAMLENDLQELGFKNEDIGAGFYLKRQLQLERAKSELVVTNNFITEVEAKKAELA